MSNKRVLIIADILWLLILFAYILGGVETVPLHGDEPTTIWMAKDAEIALEKGQFDELAYEPPPQRTTEQHLRIVTANLVKIVYWVAWKNSNAPLNDQWVWGADLDWNRANGHVPNDKLLHSARFASALMLWIGAGTAWATARILTSRLFSQQWAIRISAGMASGLYTLHPALLVTGRRAMFEGGLLMGLALVGLVAVHLSGRMNWRIRDMLLLGGASGIAISTKHSAAFTLVLLYVGLWFYSRRPVDLLRRGLQLALSGGIAIAIFYVLHPIWWSDPLMMPEVVIDERQGILDVQTQLFGEFDSPQDRLSALHREIFLSEPQYYEAPDWITYRGVQAEIDHYDHSAWVGLKSSLGADILRYVLLVSGLVTLVRGWRRGEARLLLLWGIGILVITFFTVPLYWQRYYLPIQIPMLLVMGVGGGKIVVVIGSWQRITP